MANRKTYQRTLPRKRISAGCLLFDKRGHLLVVNPTYKKNWEIPGGTVEEHESPRRGCEREVLEELGLKVNLNTLLGVDYIADAKRRTEALAFIFYGGVLNAAEIDAIRLPRNELSEYRFIDTGNGLKLLNRRLRRRVSRCLDALATDQTHYLEEQDIIRFSSNGHLR